MAFKELVSPTLKELFITEIEAMILSGELKIGDKLPPERKLAEEMKVSQAVVNGGIIDLANKGFLKVYPRKGTYVADYKSEGKIEILQSIIAYNGGHFDPQMMNSLLEIRECLERSEVVSAAKNASKDDVDRLRSIIDKVKVSDGPVKQSKVMTEFYYGLSKISGNIIHPLIFYSFRPIYLSKQEVLYKHGFLKTELSLLNELLSLIEQGKGEEAADCISKIIVQVRSVFETVLAK